MMNIKEILEALSDPGKPVVKTLHACQDSKIMILGFKKGMKLPKHQSPVPAVLWVLKGTVTYTEDGHKEMLEEMECKNIPPKTDHEVYAYTDSFCLLIQQKKP